MSAKTSPFLICRDCTCSALRRASRAVTQHFEAYFRGTGLRATQFTVLAALAQTGPLAISLLAAELGLERTSLTRNLRPLEKKGFVVTLADDDQRIRLIKITKRGEPAALAALGAWKQAQSSVGEVLNRSGVRERLISDKRRI
jgi:DNA-binding MarR family transcriptional regulator